MFLGKYGAIAGGLAIVACWPFATGQIAQSMYEREVDQRSTPEFTLEQQAYERGYLSSQAVTRIEFQGESKAMLAQSGLPVSYEITSDISHGVIGVSSSNTLVMTPELQAITQKAWPGNPTPVRLQLDTLMTGASDYHLTVAPFSLSEASSNLTASELSLKGEIDRKGHVKANFSLPALAFNDDSGQQLKVDSVSGTGNGYLQDGLWIGEQALSIEKAHFSDISGQSLKLGHVTLEIGNELVESESTRELNNTNQLTVGTIALPNKTQWRNLVVALDANHLDYSAMSQIAQLSSQWQEEGATVSMKMLDQALVQLLQSGLSINLSPASLTLPEGDVSVDMHLNLKDGDPTGVFNLQQLVNQVSGDLDVSVPNGVLTHSPWQEKVSNLASAGFVTQTDENTVLTAKIEGNQVVASDGTAVPLVQFVMFMLM
ncbi:DUF945 family protein [Salinivibrio sp. ES.052]|uniref:DUF945 family protein n=1 Tax=Salinivibrio sp. ES.052 TaxID=1882823 RepID=UPI00092ADFC4|nr:DUF945 family protein [Salinivibrio sp. ES.052]SIN82080.1 Uncharacterized conserved protein YdgA, DUF945 family [Salinivibrio sp. ES.052]